MRPADYIRSGRRGRAAHDMEAEALRDPLLAEALEGFDTVDGDHAAAVESLRRRIAFRTRRTELRPALRRLAAIAALTALLLTGGYLRTHRPAIPEAATVPPAELLAEVPGPAAPHAAGPTDAPAPQRHPAPPSPTESQTTAPEGPRRALPDRTTPQPSDTTAGPVAADAPAEGRIADPEEAVVLAYGTNLGQEFVGSVRIHGSKSAAADGEEQPSPAAERMPTFRGGRKVPVKFIPLADFRPQEPLSPGRTLEMWVRARLTYPEQLRKQGVAGRVTASVTIDTAGYVAAVAILDSPHPRLTRKTLRLLRRAPRQTPVRRRGEAVEERFLLTFDFPNDR